METLTVHEAAVPIGSASASEFRGAVERTRSYLTVLDGLSAAGASISDRNLRVVSVDISTLDGIEVQGASTALADMVSGSELAVVGEDFRVTVHLAGGVVSIADCTRDGDGSRYEGLLEAVEAGDLDQLWRLPGRWEGSLDANLASALARLVPEIEWRVVRDPALVATALRESHWYGAHEWFGRGRRPFMFVTPAGSAEDSFIADGVALCTFAAGSDHLCAFARRLIAQEERRNDADNRRRSVTGRPEDQLVRPEIMARLDDGDVRSGAWSDVVRLLISYAGAHALAWLSSGVVAPDWPSPPFDVPLKSGEDPDAQTRSRVVVVGLQRSAFPIDAGGPNPKAATDAMRLHEWACADQSPDRVLAVRQVLSLLTSDSVMSELGGVRSSAEPIYVGLRRDTVDAVYQNQRQTRDRALAAAQRTIDFAQATSKAVAERVLAALVGLGGVALAQVSNTVPIALGRRLGEIIALYLFAVAAWTVIVDGRLLMTPLADLEVDLGVIGDLLTETQRVEVAQLAAVRSASRNARIVRATSTAIYLVVASAVLILSVPSIAHWLHVSALLK